MIRKVIKIILILVVLGLLCWGALIGWVCYQEAHAMDDPAFDGIIVLGAQVKKDGSLSVQLQWRLDKAVEAYRMHPCTVVCSGARGHDEPEAEGTVMRRYLIAQGIPEADVIAECEAFDTRQNLQFSKRLLGDDVKRVCIVTSDYHMPRAIAMAADEGISACGMGAPTKPEYWLKNHAREAIAWVKYFIERTLNIQFTVPF